MQDGCQVALKHPQTGPLAFEGVALIEDLFSTLWFTRRSVPTPADCPTSDRFKCVAMAKHVMGVCILT